MQSYTSLLITYIIAPNNPPLIESVDDLIKTTDIKLVVDLRSGFDDVISVYELLCCKKRLDKNLFDSILFMKIYDIKYTMIFNNM